MLSVKFKNFQRWYKKKQRKRVGSYSTHEKAYDTIILCSHSFKELYKRLECYYEREGIRFECDFHALFSLYLVEMN